MTARSDPAPEAEGGDRRVRPVPGFDPRRGAAGAGGLLLFLAVSGLYLATYSSVPTSDGYAWIAHIGAGDRQKMLPAYHALPMYLVFELRQLLAGLGVDAGPLSLIQVVNAVLAGTAAALLYGSIRWLGGGMLLGWLGGGLLALSFGSWYFANGELHHFPLVVLQLIFLLLVRARVRGARWGLGFPIALGALNAVAIMLHQESVLFGFTAVALLWAGRPWRQGLRDGLLYTLAGSAATAVLAVTIAVYLRGVASADEFWRWFLWPLYAADQPQPYTLGGPAMIVLKILKGKLVALVLGTQVVADAARDGALLAFATVRWLLAGTAVVYGLMAVLLIDLARRRRRLPRRLVVAGVGCAVWILSYDVFLHSWFWPAAPEYHVSALPPLILLVLLGPMAARAGGRAARAPGWRPAVVAALLLLVAAINVQGGIRPWYRYGVLKEALTAGRLVPFRPGDFFVSSESGLDPVLAVRGRHLAVKDVFTAAAKADGFALIDASIADRVARGQRVFVYNFVPGAFTLLGLNQAAARRGAPPLAAGDFEEFMAALGRRHETVAAAAYWEEAKAPLYLFGERAETMWEIRPRTIRGRWPRRSERAPS